MTAIAIVRVDMWLQAYVFDIVLFQHTHNNVKKHAKMAMNIFDEINLDKELEVFSVGGLKEWYMEVLGFLLQMENIQNLYLNFSFTIMIVFTIVQVSIRYCDS